MPAMMHGCERLVINKKNKLKIKCLEMKMLGGCVMCLDSIELRIKI